MPAFPKPKFNFNYDLNAEINSLLNYKSFRQIPDKDENFLLIATWNIANFGIQDRRDKDLKLIAEIINWFDIIAIQETRQNLQNLKVVLSFLGKNYSANYTDTSGNNERMVFIYDTKKTALRELVGEVAPYPSDLKNIKFESITETFKGFDRNPFIRSFRWKDLEFCLANVHLYFGTKENEKASIERRELETFAIARWAKMQSSTKFNSEKNIILLGDFNLPQMDMTDPVYRALTKYGLIPTEHSTLIGATLSTEPKSRTKTIYHYDQLAFLPGLKANFTNETGTFDFDGALFKDLWSKVENKKLTQSQFNGYLRYYISDHRPLWARFRN